MIELKSGTRIWIAAGFTDLRRVWPKTQSGTVSLSRAQLSMLLEGIDWRRVERTWGHLNKRNDAYVSEQAAS